MDSIIRFVIGKTITLEEDLTCEFKELTSKRPADSIANTADEYAVAFLNSRGGKIFWGIRNDGMTVGVMLTAGERDRVQQLVHAKLNEIRPHLDPTRFSLSFHSIEGDPSSDLRVVELSVPDLNSDEPYYTGSSKLFIRVEGVKRELKGPQITDWIKKKIEQKKTDSEGKRPRLVHQLLSRKKSEVEIVAKRFLRIFKDHGVPITQIPRLMPQITLDKLTSEKTLLPALTDQVLQKTADLFQIRREWLEGVGEQIYDCPSCYKNPTRFFEELAKLKDKQVFAPVIAFSCTDTLDSKHKEHQPIAIVLNDKLGELGPDEVYRYRVFDDDWHWDYSKCRVQLKAMMRLVFLLLDRCVPAYRVNEELMGELRSGYMVPFLHIQPRNRIHELYLEDFGLTPEESAISQENEETQSVMEYIKHWHLDDVAAQLLGINYK